MKKKILISALSILFLVSTTGLPVTINLCNMAGDMDKSECTMHNKPVKSLCCAEQAENNISTITFHKPNCCQVEFVYNKVNDDFICSKTDINPFSSSEKLFQSVASLIPSDNYIDIISFTCDSSPPFLINPDLHITNSILLI